MRRTNTVWSHVTHGRKNGRGAAGAGGEGRGSWSDSRPDMRRQYSIASRRAWARGRSEPRGHMKHQSEGSGPGPPARTGFPPNEGKAFFEEGGEVNRLG